MRKYGARRDLHDVRDRVYLSGAVSIPDAVDLRPWCGPVKDQGQEGSCTGHAGSSSMEWQFRRYKNQSPILSPQFLYCEELIKEGTFPNDGGAMPRTICQVLNQIGVCEESVEPYVAGQIRQPTPDQMRSAAKYRVGGYHRLEGFADLLSVLGDPTPWPVLLSFNVPQSFESLGPDGVLKPSGMIMGGHETLAVGYDKHRQVVIIQNSWGPEFADHGFFYMPFSMVQDQNWVTDLWVAHIGHWN